MHFLILVIDNSSIIIIYKYWAGCISENSWLTIIGSLTGIRSGCNTDEQIGMFKKKKCLYYYVYT